MITIRPFQATDPDYAALVAIHNAVWPTEITTVTVARYRDAQWPADYFFQRLVAEAAGKPVGMARLCEPHWSYRPGKYELIINVHPAYQRQGIGAALYNQALQLATQRTQPPTVLVSTTSEAQPGAIRFLTARDFTQQMRFPTSALQVADFDPTPFANAFIKMATRGVQIATVAELSQHDPDWQAKIWELDCTCTLDEPLPDTFTPPTLEQYVAEEFGNPGFLPEACFIAHDGGYYVGMTTLGKDLANPRQLQVGFTAVRREYRRYGIATALKLRAIAFGQAYGAAAMVTDNEENNPMYQINLRLGFQPKPAKLAFQKEINPHA